MAFDEHKTRTYKSLPDFVWLADFDEDWARFRLTEGDAVELEASLHLDPDAGAVIAGTNGLRKVRFSPSSVAKGKSGAFRVFYLNASARGYIFLFAIIAKNEDANVSKAVRNLLAAEVARIKGRLRA